MRQLEYRLSQPVYFVLRNFHDRWRDVLEGSNTPHPDDVYNRIASPANSWIAHTYLRLKREGLNVQLVTDYVANEINITVAKECGGTTRTDRAFIVCCQHDRYSAPLAHIRVVQNPLQVKNRKRDYYVQHWPQPGLMPRDPTRGDSIENVVYQGSYGNIDSQFKTDTFRDRLQSLGLSLKLSQFRNSSNTGIDWRNYSDADIVLAVRNLTQHDVKCKPISKLANAWLAGCPAILGPEPGYRAVRKSDLDYLEARTEDEVIQHLTYLIENKDVYRAMVENAKQRAHEVGPEQVKQRWIDVLYGPVLEEFQKWNKANRLIVSFWRPAQFAVRLARHEIDRKIHAYRATHGPRILDTPL